MAGGREQECQSQSSAFSSASGSARAAAGALGPRGAASGAAQRQQLLQSLLQVWQCGFTLYIPPPGGPRPRPRASRSSSSSTAFLPPARSLARGWRRRRRSLGRASCPSSRGAAAETRAPERRRPVRRPGGGRTREPGSCGRPGPGALKPAPLSGLLLGLLLLLPGSEEEVVAAAALASSRLARSLRGAYTCVTDRAKSQLLPGSAADVSDPQPLGGRIVQAE